MWDRHSETLQYSNCVAFNRARLSFPKRKKNVLSQIIVQLLKFLLYISWYLILSTACQIKEITTDQPCGKTEEGKFTLDFPPSQHPRRWFHGSHAIAMFYAKIRLVGMVQFHTSVPLDYTGTEHCEPFQLFPQVHPDESLHPFSSQRPFGFYHNSSQANIDLYTYIFSFSPNPFYRYSFPFSFLCLFIHIFCF